MGGLAGKWVWVWNWRRCDGGDADRVAAQLKASGCTGALVKAFDRTRWFDQGVAWRDIAQALKARGVSVGGWGYCYGDDPAGEAARAIETARHGQADLLVLDVESELKRKPQQAEALCIRIRAELGPDYPLYFSSFALPQYHREFPFHVFNRYCSGAAPQVYWNAFAWPVSRALEETYRGHASLGIAPERVFPVGGLYQQGMVLHPPVDEVRAFIRDSGGRGSSGVSFWSYEHMNERMWRAVADAGLTPGEVEEVMSSLEFEQLTQAVSQLTSRVHRLEVAVATINPPATRTYTVQAGDTLSGIAAKLGVSSWQRLYEMNRGIIGADPNRIYPGQVLVVP